MPSDSPRDSLPFEPSSKRKKASPNPAQGKASQKPAEVAAKPATIDAKTTSVSRPQSASRTEAAIPEVVSRRMLRRMIIFSGMPTFLGVGIFFLSYFLLINHILEFPKYVVLFTTLACFGLGVAGLSYGALSASWDEDRLGTWFGRGEFQTNFSRLTEAWRTSRNS